MSGGRAAKSTFGADSNIRVFREIYDLIQPGVRRAERACLLFVMGRAGTPGEVVKWMEAVVHDAAVLRDAVERGEASEVVGDGVVVPPGSRPGLGVVGG